MIIGAKIGLELKSHDCEGILEELSVFWADHGLGEMTLLNGDQTGITVINCYHCGKNAKCWQDIVFHG